MIWFKIPCTWRPKGPKKDRVEPFWISTIPATLINPHLQPINMGIGLYTWWFSDDVVQSIHISYMYTVYVCGMSVHWVEWHPVCPMTSRLVVPPIFDESWFKQPESEATPQPRPPENQAWTKSAWKWVNQTSTSRCHPRSPLSDLCTLCTSGMSQRFPISTLGLVLTRAHIALMATHKPACI